MDATGPTGRRMHRCRCSRGGWRARLGSMARGATKVRVARTSESRFADLEDFPFRPRYSMIDDRDVGNMRIHYVDEGPRHGPVVVLMHGEPVWGYLFRHVIAPLTDAGCRCVVPDLVGFGRSDKPIAYEAYSYRRQVRWMSQTLLGNLELRDITMCCNDWGGLIGLRMVAATPDRFHGVVATNTALPTGDEPVTPELLEWIDVSQAMPDLRPSDIVQTVVSGTLSPGERRAYDAPFESHASASGLRAFPTLVPLDVDDLDAADNRAAWHALRRYRRPCATVFGTRDPLMAHWQSILCDRIPGAADAPHMSLHDAGMLVPEDAPNTLVDVILEVVRHHRRP